MLRELPIFGRQTPGFTLQWHLTNDCELRCSHCYDREDLGSLSTAECMGVLEQLDDFRKRHDIYANVTLTGGNPLMHPGFWEIYESAARKGMGISILGNPVSRHIIERLLKFARPEYYQVSLEGLPETNDAIRGRGHFARTVTFLKAARKAGLTTHVMTTLHSANIHEIIPLADELAGLTQRYMFNRLVQVGEGTDLTVPDAREYRQFLVKYLERAAENPVMGMKDNFFNILRREKRAPLFGGCTGFGCGAAFNFVALLPSGEVHACRKFTSPIGNIRQTTLERIYHSQTAARYRLGPSECFGCPLRNSCRGCMAVTYGQGKDPFKTRDPQCFRHERSTANLVAKRQLRVVNT
jgi:selenobiotic family peptide radical SAM maturase